jgi:hypothetical protein
MGSGDVAADTLIEPLCSTAPPALSLTVMALVPAVWLGMQWKRASVLLAETVVMLLQSATVNDKVLGRLLPVTR